MKNYKLHFCSLYLIGAIGLLVWSAWVVEDAFITFRTVANFVDGYGLRWNVAERVQVYTHPLWMFLVAAVYFFTGEIYYTAIFTSIAVTTLALAVLGLLIAPTARYCALACAVLCSSQAFVDYSTSGLENPLSHLLIAAFSYLCLHRGFDRKTYFSLCLVAGLAAFNRMDTILLYLPVLLYVTAQRKSYTWIWPCAAGFAPFIAWELFSLIYYGFPFPNTAYAKLNTGIDASDLALRGLEYLLDSLRNDPVTLSALAAALALLSFRGSAVQRLLAVGAALYITYIVSIGGGYMRGRFLSAPLFAALCTLPPCASLSRARVFVPALLVVLCLNLVSPTSTLVGGITSKRDEFFTTTSLLRAWGREDGTAFPNHPWAERGRQARARDLYAQDIRTGGYLTAQARNGSTLVTTWTAVGFSGFYAGPEVHIVDALALTDPLLARLPPYYQKEWTAGHLERLVPDGYIETQLSGRNELVDPKLNAYYDKLALVTRGPLFSRDRWIAIWELNMAHHDHLIDYDAYRSPSELRVLQNRVRVRPGNAVHRIALGKALIAENATEDAIEQFRWAMRFNPDSFSNHYNIGLACFQKGLFKEAITAFSRAVELDGKVITNARLNLAAALASTGAYEKAEVLLKGILQREPKNAHVLHNLGRIAQRRGRVAEALAYLERAVRLGYDDGTHAALRRLYEESQ